MTSSKKRKTQPFLLIFFINLVFKLLRKDCKKVYKTLFCAISKPMFVAILGLLASKQYDNHAFNLVFADLLVSVSCTVILSFITHIPLTVGGTTRI